MRTSETVLLSLVLLFARKGDLFPAVATPRRKFHPSGLMRPALLSIGLPQQATAPLLETSSTEAKPRHTATTVTARTSARTTTTPREAKTCHESKSKSENYVRQCSCIKCGQQHCGACFAVSPQSLPAGRSRILGGNHVRRLKDIHRPDELGATQR